MVKGIDSERQRGSITAASAAYLNIGVQLASGEKDFAENAWVNHTLAIGTAVRLNITGPCGRCVMTTLAQRELARDPGILRTAAQHNHVNVGVYAAVVQSGTIRRGDPVRIEQPDTAAESVQTWC